MSLSEAYAWLIELLGEKTTIAVLTLLGYFVFRFLWSQTLAFGCLLHSRSRALSAVSRENTTDGLREGKGLWLQPTSKPENYLNSFGTRILVVANNKGGVAKTTLAANLGAFWSREWSKKVLLIDLDYQGTLSSMALRELPSWVPVDQDSLASRMISGDIEPSIFVKCAVRVPAEPNLHIIPSYYDLAQAENRLVIEWLLRCAQRKNKELHKMIADFLVGNLFVRADVRYNLAEVLQTASVRNAFDIVIIDCPPRITTGTIQALCAATHVLVPTLLDLPSAEAALAYCDELQTLKTGGICPKLDYVGVVGTMVSARVDQVAETSAMALITEGLQRQNFPSGLLETRHFMRRSTAFVRDAEEGIAYLAMGNISRQREIKEAMGALAEYVGRQVGLPEPQAHERG